MGKGTIISAIGDGQYQVQINYDRRAYDRIISTLDDNIAKITAKLAGLDPVADEAEYSVTSLQKTALELRKSSIVSSMPADYTVQTWCADMTDDLSGEVGLIEVPGESSSFNIQPGYDGASGYNLARDGQLVPTVAQRPAQAFYNIAMLPGWQKWRPTYRYGAITSINGDTATVALDSAESSQQDINVNQTSTLTDVPVDYMDCNGGAFSVGDEVLIQFQGQDWAAPKIIGFKENPKPCARPFYLRFIFNGHDPVNGGEKVRIQFPDDPDLDYSQLFRLPLDTEDGLNLVGPFIMSEDKELGLSINCEFMLGDNSYINQYSYYHNYFVETTADDPDRTHYSYVEIVENESIPGSGDQLHAVFGQGQSHPSATNYWVKHPWLKSKVDLSNATFAEETINDELFQVYTIDWSVYGITEAVTIDNGYSSGNTSCGIENSTLPESGIITSTLATTFPLDLGDSNFGERCFGGIGIGEYATCKTWSSYFNISSYPGFTAGNLCIRINAETGELTFNAASKQYDMVSLDVAVQEFYNDPIDGWEWVQNICYQASGYSGAAKKIEYTGLELLTEDFF